MMRTNIDLCSGSKDEEEEEIKRLKFGNHLLDLVGSILNLILNPSFTLLGNLT